MNPPSLCATLSGGKDSTCTTILLLEAVRRHKTDAANAGRHFVMSADTTIENPAVMWHLSSMLDEIAQGVAEEGLPLAVHIARPSLASQFVVSTIGRGTLPRTAQNGTWNGKRIRPCSTDWKVVPQNRLRAELEREVRGPIVTALGNRLEESASRQAAMTDRGETADAVLRSVDGNLTVSPIADWQLDDVWTFLALFGDGCARPFPSPVSAGSIERMLQLYRDGNEGTCGVVLGDAGSRAACGSRFGCAFCCVSGERDRSMESMVNEPHHAHLGGLNRFRNYLLATQWDLGRRELVGRKLSPSGHVRVRPDVLSYAERINLLRYLLTLDALEAERAEQHDADLASGMIPDTPTNRDLCSVQFEMVSPRQLVAIDFFLSMHHYAPHAFPALSIWYEVHRLGRRYPVPAVERFRPVHIPTHGWFKVGAWDADVPVDGLRDYSAESWNPYRHPERAGRFAQTTAGERIVWHDEGDHLAVDAEAACGFVTCSFDHAWYARAQHFHAIDSARFWLNEAFVTLPRGQSQRYQEMAKRGQYFARLAERLNFTPAEFDRYLIEQAVRCPGEPDGTVDAGQLDLFAMAA
ncbi:phosphoadenosine phosphosulfate reductase family protein [Paraburkholderia kururiensis]|uniref:phosphoadenosine phosphosulfate reductase domain-containing protein n=1 Tax=Paraburkholderia kururiensis TaxID=984307 RepID=UPI000F864440|nr:phosphoadenosine phosphosulfate reductase family protein [Paraburkholderia kururiensis]